MPTRGNPLAISVIGELKFEAFPDQFKRLTQRIERDDNGRQVWLDVCRKIEKQLRGKTERTNPPWKDACDLAPPLTKKLLRRWIPVVYNLTALADPLSHFKATEPKAALVAPTAEEFFTWLVRDYMEGSLEEIAYLAHNVAANGQDYLGVSWDYKTEMEVRIAVVDNIWPNGPPQDEGLIAQTLIDQYDILAPTRQVLEQLKTAATQIAQGAKYVKLEYRRTTSDKPRITWWPSGRVIVPVRSGNAHDGSYVCLVHDKTASELKQMALDGILDMQAVDDVIFLRNKEASTEDTVARNTTQGNSNNDSNERSRLMEMGVSDIDESDLIRVHQVYCLMDKNQDGIDERVVLWYVPGVSDNTILAVHDFPFSFKYWPVFRFDYERVARGPYQAQGMGQQLEAIQEQYTKQYRATSDAIDIQLAPVFQFRCTSKLQPRSIKWGPGKVIPVAQIGDFAPVEKSPFNLHEYLQDRGELKTFAEEMVGSIDAALAATGKKLERRTAFEVQAVSGQIEAMQGMDAAIWQMTMQKVFQCIWEMWLDLGPEEVYFAVTTDSTPRPFKKSEHNYKYQLIPAGTPGNTNRQAELSRVVQLIQLFAQIAPDILNRDFAMLYLSKLIDPRLSKQIVLPEAQRRVYAILNEAAARIATGDIPKAALAFMGQESQGAAPVATGL